MRERTRSLVRNEKAHELKSPQVHRHQPALPARWFYGFLRALSGDRAFLSPSPCRSSARFNASVEASRPHDFAVRAGIARPAIPARPPHFTPNVRDDREAPLLIGRETGQARKGDLPVGASKKIRSGGWTSPNQLELAREIAFERTAAGRRPNMRRNRGEDSRVGPDPFTCVNDSVGALTAGCELLAAPTSNSVSCR